MSVSEKAAKPMWSQKFAHSVGLLPLDGCSKCSYFQMSSKSIDSENLIQIRSQLFELSWTRYNTTPTHDNEMQNLFRWWRLKLEVSKTHSLDNSGPLSGCAQPKIIASVGCDLCCNSAAASNTTSLRYSDWWHH